MKVFEIPLYNQCVCSIGLMFEMMIDVSPKFFILYHPTHVCDIQVKVTNFNFGTSFLEPTSSKSLVQFSLYVQHFILYHVYT